MGSTINNRSKTERVGLKTISKVVGESVLGKVTFSRVQFGAKLYRQVVGIPMANICAPLVADLFLLCYERDFMMSHSSLI